MKENFTLIVGILDASSSMAPLTDETIIGYNTFIDKQRQAPGEAAVTLAVFSSADHYRLVHNAVPLQSVPSLTRLEYRPSGWTALHDAIARTIDSVGVSLAAMAEEDRPSKVLVVIMTDGQENSSVSFHAQDVLERITHQTQKYAWEFVFIGANQDDVVAVGQSLGVAATNSYNYVASAAGSAQLFDSLSEGVTAYRNASVGTAYAMSDPTAGLNDNPQLGQIAAQVDPFGFQSSIINVNPLSVSPVVPGLVVTQGGPVALDPTAEVSVTQSNFKFTINDPFTVIAPSIKDTKNDK